jgi:hypothetical protein
LNFVDCDALRSPDQVPWGALGLIEDIQVIEGQIEAAGFRGELPDERRLAGLPGSGNNHHGHR